MSELKQARSLTQPGGEGGRGDQATGREAARLTRETDSRSISSVSPAIVYNIACLTGEGGNKKSGIESEEMGVKASITWLADGWRREASCVDLGSTRPPGIKRSAARRNSDRHPAARRGLPIDELTSDMEKVGCGRGVGKVT
jgi:hypothetical protein